MRLPKESELSREQKEICYAPTEGTVLVEGPPGSGKTVVALYRAKALETKEEGVTTLVYNHVLRRYTDTNITFYRWVDTWWRGTFGQRLPADFSSGRRKYDFEEASRTARDESETIRENGHWGHLILDEAQDFAPEAHRLLSIVTNLVFDQKSSGKKPSIMVLADENQILTSNNSTLEQIMGEYFLCSDEIYGLEKNYRNTREVAEFARHFYCGTPSGVPQLPESRGDKPRLLVTDSIDAAVKRIVKYTRLHDSEEIGVLVFHEKTRRKLFNKLEFRLKGTGVRVQTYSSQYKQHRNPSKLVFDKGGVISVLCFASSKGLEFDTVFLPELQTLPVDSDRRDQMRMSLYVMTSRARRRLFSMISDPEGQSGVWDLLPPRDKGLYEFETL